MRLAHGGRRRAPQSPAALVGTDFFPVKYMRQLEALTPGVEFLEDDDLIRNIRRIKSPRELDCYREAGEMTSVALNSLSGLLAGPRAQCDLWRETQFDSEAGVGIGGRHL